MKNINIGVVNLVVSDKLKESYFNDSLINETKNNLNDFLSIVKNSPILQLEFKVYNNIEDKYIKNEFIGSRYIDNNIKLFEVYTLDEIQKEHDKLNKFINEELINNLDESYQEKIKLYNSINTLINESLCDYSKINVDDIHESFTYILNHIKTPKTKSTLNSENLLNEAVIEIAVDKYNEKYESLTKEDRNLIKTLVKSNDVEKKELLENYKQEALMLLEKHNTTTNKDWISKATLKINEMIFNKDSVDDNVIELYDLKKNL